MNIILNGKATCLAEGASIMNLLKSKDIDPMRVVVELNLDIVKKEQLDNIILKENDKLEVLKFVGGG